MLYTVSNSHNCHYKYGRANPCRHTHTQKNAIGENWLYTFETFIWFVIETSDQMNVLESTWIEKKGINYFKQLFWLSLNIVNINLIAITICLDLIFNYTGLILDSEYKSGTKCCAYKKKKCVMIHEQTEDRLYLMVYELKLSEFTN